ncbi:unnamed protein product [Blepharisma stoltei]|uniref:Uncharacterized protein n=1 Tax=Blepharisma stoltei TaxID=1481888 RepID=A0AAU9IJS6_9CILI|nr:unnamed protein product [Blepharisma stoltei]
MELENVKRRSSFLGSAASSENSRKPDSNDISKILLKQKRREREHKALLPKNLIRSVSREVIHSHTDKSYNALYETSPRRKKEKLRQARQLADPLTSKESIFTTDPLCKSYHQVELKKEYPKFCKLLQRDHSHDIYKRVSDLCSKEKENTCSAIEGINKNYRRSITKNIHELNAYYSKENEFSDYEVGLIMKNHQNLKMKSYELTRKGSLTGRQKSARPL